MVKNIDFNTENYLPIMTPKFLANLYGAYKPTKAVTEMIDNSIDAKSTRIKISCCENADTVLTISDNGNGIKYENIHSVLDFGVSNKTRNNDSIGCFGCGLKAVPYHLIDEQFTNNITMQIDTVSDGVQTIAERLINTEDYTQESLTWNVSTRKSLANNGTTITLFGVNINKKDVETIKTEIRVRYNRDLKKNKCEIIFNNEKLTPIDPLYSGHIGVTTKKKSAKTNDEKKMKVGFKIATLDNENVALKATLKRHNSKINKDTSGIYIYCGNICITKGGVDSWNHLGLKQWSPYNPVRISIDIPIKYKNQILDSDKTQTKTYLYDMKTVDGKCIFEDVITSIKEELPKQKQQKSVINNKKNKQPSFKSFEEPFFQKWNTLPKSFTETQKMKEIHYLMVQMFDGKTYMCEGDSEG